MRNNQCIANQARCKSNDFESAACGSHDQKVLDVRMVEEYVFLGHAEAAVNSPGRILLKARGSGRR